jgi:hypothetical protein
MEESVPQIPTEFVLKIWLLSLAARGRVAILLAVPVSILLLAIAFRLVWR